MESVSEIRERIDYAQIDWTEDGVPRSRDFGDIYYSREGGREETRHVFLEGNRLFDRFLHCQDFTIGELGFGTGLNFLTAANDFLELSDKKSTLDYFSCEFRPMRKKDMARALSPFCFSHHLKEILIESWVPPVPGFHRLLFADGRISLNLYLGDVLDFLQAFSGPADAWFLDGFAPSRNDQMWTDTVLGWVAKKSRPGTTASTFSSARKVFDAMQSSSFFPEKKAGFGEKRDMIVGVYRPTEDPHGNDQEWDPREKAADFCRRQPGRPFAIQTESPFREETEQKDPLNASTGPALSDPNNRAAVIGGGIAGASVAFSLARRGYQVDLFEKEPEVASRASGNPAGIMFPFLNAHPTPMSSMIAQGFLHTFNRIQFFQKHSHEIRFRKAGVIQIAHDARQKKRFESALEHLGYPEEFVQLVLSSDIEALSHWPSESTGVYFPAGSILHPPHLSKASVNFYPERISLHTGTMVSKIQQQADQSWVLLDDQNSVVFQGPVVVVAAAQASADFEQTSWLPLKPNRGQIALVPASEKSSRLNCVICYDGYTIPEIDGVHIVGATYEKGRVDENVDPIINQRLMAQSNQWLKGIFDPDQKEVSGRVGFRSMGMDHLPLVGAVPDREKCLSYLREQHSDLSGIVHSGLFVSAGHGSRGMIYAPLAGEIIASSVAGVPLPVEEKYADELSPYRFIRREWKKEGGIISPRKKNDESPGSMPD